jgi:hypothetical protein
MYWLAIIGFFLAIYLAARYYPKYAKYVNGGSDWDIR